MTDERIHLLVADDDEDSRTVLAVRLQARGYRVSEAADGAEALEMIRRDQPHLVLLDVMMPKMDGREVVARLKADETLPFTPVIMQTALDTVDDKVAGLEAGADDYVTKPIQFQELEARIRSLLRIRSLQLQLAAQARSLTEMNERLAEMSRTDSLTGLDNRRGAEERLADLAGQARRLQLPLTVIVADLDHFKAVNDTYGHAAGDDVLRGFSRRLRDALRTIDVAGRWGGEEFIVVLPGTPPERGAVIAERIRASVERAPFRTAEGSVSMTVSLGVAGARTAAGMVPEQLVAAADGALYRAKREGRNRVVAVPSGEAPDAAPPRDVVTGPLPDTEEAELEPAR